MTNIKLKQTIYCIIALLLVSCNNAQNKINKQPINLPSNSNNTIPYYSNIKEPGVYYNNDDSNDYNTSIVKVQIIDKFGNAVPGFEMQIVPSNLSGQSVNFSPLLNFYHSKSKNFGSINGLNYNVYNNNNITLQESLSFITDSNGYITFLARNDKKYTITPANKSYYMSPYKLIADTTKENYTMMLRSGTEILVYGQQLNQLVHFDTEGYVQYPYTTVERSINAIVMVYDHDVAYYAMTFNPNSDDNIYDLKIVKVTYPNQNYQGSTIENFFLTSTFNNAVSISLMINNISNSKQLILFTGYDQNDGYIKSYSFDVNNPSAGYVLKSSIQMDYNTTGKLPKIISPILGKKFLLCVPSQVSPTNNYNLLVYKLNEDGSISNEYKGFNMDFDNTKTTYIEFDDIKRLMYITDTTKIIGIKYDYDPNTDPINMTKVYDSGVLPYTISNITLARKGNEYFKLIVSKSTNQIAIYDIDEITGNLELSKDFSMAIVTGPLRVNPFLNYARFYYPDEVKVVIIPLDYFLNAGQDYHKMVEI